MRLELSKKVKAALDLPEGKSPLFSLKEREKIIEIIHDHP